MFVIVARFLFRNRFNGLTVWPFIFLKDEKLKNNAVFLNHEKIHFRQQIELLILPFYIWYGFEFLIRWVNFGDNRKAYRNIGFEREAYQKEKDLQYLKNRPLWNFLKYV
jgi:hypothetical protein